MARATTAREMDEIRAQGVKDYVTLRNAIAELPLWWWLWLVIAIGLSIFEIKPGPDRPGPVR